MRVKIEINRYGKADTESNREWDRDKDSKTALRFNKYANFTVA